MIDRVHRVYFLDKVLKRVGLTQRINLKRKGYEDKRSFRICTNPKSSTVCPGLMYTIPIDYTAYLEHFDGDGDFTSRRRRPVAFPDDAERAVAQFAVKAEIFLVDETRQRLGLGVVRAEVRR